MLGRGGLVEGRVGWGWGWGCKMRRGKGVLGLHWSGGRMTDRRGTRETMNDATSVGGGRGTEMEGVVDRECHWKGPEGLGRNEWGERGGIG